MPDPARVDRVPDDQRDAAVRAALDALDTALYETDAGNLSGVSGEVLDEVDAWAGNVQLHIARVRRARAALRKDTP